MTENKLLYLILINIGLYIFLFVVTMSRRPFLRKVAYVYLIYTGISTLTWIIILNSGIKLSTTALAIWLMTYLPILYMIKFRPNIRLEDEINRKVVMSDTIIKIKKTWNLPKKYLNFLIDNEKGKYIEDHELITGLHIYGASELLEGQKGYSFNPVTNEIINSWTKNYIVIGDDGGNPYVLDLSKSNGNDAPVLYAIRGLGSWDFKMFKHSFSALLVEYNVSSW